eukprot:63915_1
MAPMYAPKQAETSRADVQAISEQCFMENHFCTKITNWDQEEDKYMSIFVNWRGDIKAKEANAVSQWLRTNKKVTFVDRNPYGIRNQLFDYPIATLEDDDIAPTKRHISMVGNNTAISRVFEKRIIRKYDKLYAKRAFIHLYVGEGMEESELIRAKIDLEQLSRDYKYKDTLDSDDESDSNDDESDSKNDEDDSSTDDDSDSD